MINQYDEMRRREIALHAAAIQHAGTQPRTCEDVLDSADLYFEWISRPTTPIELSADPPTPEMW